MATPDFVLRLRDKIGTDPLWLSGVTAVVVRGDDLLLVKRSDTGAWTPVTGVIDPGEHPADAGVRECLEEADVVVVPERLARLGVTAPIVYDNGDETQYIDLTFRMRWVSGEPFPADGENTEAGWFPIADLPRVGETGTVSDHMLERILAALADTSAAEFTAAGSIVRH